MNKKCDKKCVELHGTTCRFCGARLKRDSVGHLLPNTKLPVSVRRKRVSSKAGIRQAAGGRGRGNVNEKCDWRGVPWKATVEAAGLAEEIVRNFADMATELLAARSGWVDEETGFEPSDEAVKIAKEDLLNVMMGHDTGCLDPEDLDETNCAFNWTESKLRDLLTTWLAAPPPASLRAEEETK